MDSDNNKENLDELYKMAKQAYSDFLKKADEIDKKIEDLKNKIEQENIKENIDKL